MRMGTLILRAAWPPRGARIITSYAQSRHHQRPVSHPRPRRIAYWRAPRRGRRVRRPATPLPPESKAGAQIRMAAQLPHGDRRKASADLDDARLQLARLHTEPGTTLREVWQQLAQLIARTLKVDRVGVWLLVDEDRAIRCRYLLQRSSQEVF